ncbi:MAG: DUF6141 family protein [Planctomycetota bacterium]|jgi:hypothetical protein
MTNRDRNGSFEETQRFSQPWIWAILLPLMAMAWYSAYEQLARGRPVGDDPAPDWVIWIVFGLVGVGIPLLLGLGRMRTTVGKGELLIDYLPLARKRIPLDDIVSHEACTYRPLLEFGGWGVRWWPGRGMAYNVKGNEGVRLVLRNGKKVLVGSQRAKELDAALISQ